MGAGTSREGVTGVVNELLVQMQSFDLPTGTRRLAARLVDAVNLFLPGHLHLPRPSHQPTNVLIVAATNRAADLDPALLRPGRFDRIVHFDLPPAPRPGGDRRLLPGPQGPPRRRDGGCRSPTSPSGYTPVGIERLLDEALICALRQDRRQMIWTDVLEAKLVTEVGLSHRVAYQPEERRRIATHEAGHALVAELVGRQVTVASILRRSDSLGLVAHTDAYERHVHTPERRPRADAGHAGRTGRPRSSSSARRRAAWPPTCRGHHRAGRPAGGRHGGGREQAEPRGRSHARSRQPRGQGAR